MPLHIDELIQLLLDSERRYAEIAALLVMLHNEEADKLIAEHDVECGMGGWHEKFSKDIPQQ